MLSNLSLFCPINTLSYGYVSTYILHELLKKNINVSLHTIGMIEQEPRFHSDIECGLAKQKRFDYFAPCLKIFHQNCLEQWVGSGERNAFPIFELNKFNDVEKHHLNNLNVDQIIVCSEWARQIVDDQIELENDVKVVPLGVDTSVFFPLTSRRKTTVFFNCGKWEKRKGHDVIPEIFNKAFSPSDDVELWMMCGHGFMEDGENEIWENHYKSTPLGDKIKFIKPVKSQSEAAYIMQQTDCGIFPSRAEGWGLPILEMMACGKWVITTNYSGQTEFSNNQNALLIDIDSLELATDNKWFKNNTIGEWANIGGSQIDQAVEYMRKIHSIKRDSNLINSNGIATARQFTWEHTVNKLLEVIND